MALRRVGWCSPTCMLTLGLLYSRAGSSPLLQFMRWNQTCWVITWRIPFSCLPPVRIIFAYYLQTYTNMCKTCCFYSIIYWQCEIMFEIKSTDTISHIKNKLVKSYMSWENVFISFILTRQTCQFLVTPSMLSTNWNQINKVMSMTQMTWLWHQK